MYPDPHDIGVNLGAGGLRAQALARGGQVIGADEAPVCAAGDRVAAAEDRGGIERKPPRVEMSALLAALLEPAPERLFEARDRVRGQRGASAGGAAGERFAQPRVEIVESLT